MSDKKLSELLKQAHVSGDSGQALNGYWEEAEKLETENNLLKAENKLLKIGVKKYVRESYEWQKRVKTLQNSKDILLDTLAGLGKDRD